MIIRDQLELTETATTSAMRRLLQLAWVGAPVLLASAVLDGGFALFLIAVQAFLPDTIDAGAASPGFALGIYGLTRVLLQGPGGLLARRFGTQRLMVLSLAGGGLSLVGLATANSAAGAYLLTLLYGIATAFAWPAIYLRASDLVAEERGELFGLLTLFTMAGMVGGLAVGVLLVDVVAHRLLVLGSGLSLFLGGVIVAGLLFWRKRGIPLHVASATVRAPSRSRRRSGVIRLFVALACQGMGLSMLLPILRHYVHNELHIEMQSLIILGAPGAIAGGLALLVAGRLIDRIGRAPIVALGSVVAALGSLVIAAASGQVLFAIGAIPLAVGYAMSAPALGAWISDLADDVGGNVGLALTVQGLSFALGPVLSGLLVTSWGSPTAIGLSAVFWLLAGIWAVLPVRSRARVWRANRSPQSRSWWASDGE